MLPFYAGGDTCISIAFYVTGLLYKTGVRFAGYYRCSIFPGSMIMPFIKPKTPSTAIPSILKGSVSIQKTGYSTNAKMANGQQRIKRMIQAMNVNIG